MRKLVLTIILSLAYFVGFTQDSKLSLGIIGAYDKYLAPKGIFNTKLTHDYKVNLSYSLGLHTQYNINEKLFLLSGFLYTSKGYEVGYNFIAIDPVELDPAIPKSASFDINNIAIPIMVGYYLVVKEKFKLSSSVGLFNEYVYRTKFTTLNYLGTEYESNKLPSGMSHVYFSSQFNLGLEYHLTKKLYLGITPYFRYAFNKISEGAMEYNPISFGGIIGVNYKFTKMPKED